MPEFRLVVSDPKSGKSRQVNVGGVQASSLIGLRMGDVINGAPFGFPGLRLQITGGSDKSGFPMVPSIPGGGKYPLLLSSPPGYHPPKEGMRKRVMVRGSIITEDVVQINMKIVEGKS